MSDKKLQDLVESHDKPKTCKLKRIAKIRHQIYLNFKKVFDKESSVKKVAHKIMRRCASERLFGNA